MSTVLPFGTNNISVYLYEPFSYTISNPYFPTPPVVTSSAGIPSGTVVSDASKVIFSSTSGLFQSSTVLENFTIDVCSGLYISSNFVSIGNGRFRDACLNSLNGQTFNFYKNETIQDISLVVAFSTSNIFSTPSLPVGLTFQSNSPTTWKITGTPLVQTASNNYQLITVNSGKTATSTINIAVNPERIRINLSGSPIISNMQIGTPIDVTTLTVPITYTSPFTYTWTSSPPDGITFKNSVGVTVTSPFPPSDASRTLVISGTPTLTGARAGNKTINVVASRGTVTNSNAFTFSFGETVLFNDASFQNPFYRGETLSPTTNSLTATTYFAGTDVSITNIFSTDLPSDLSTNFVYAQQRMYLTGTPTASIPLGTNSYTFRASNINGNTRNTAFPLTFSNDSVTISKTVVDSCFNFILSRDLASNKTGYYPSPIQYIADASSGRAVTFSATGLPSGVTLSNVTSGRAQLVGIPNAITSLQNLRVKATTSTDISASLDVSYAVLNDVITFPTVQDTSTTFFCGRPITPFYIRATTLSERPIVAYTTNNLPSGLYLSPSGLLSGTPALSTTEVGIFNVTAYTGYTTGSANYNYSLIGDEAIIETISNTYPISTTQPFGPIPILAQSYTGSNLNTSLLGDITPYQGTNSISVQLNDNQVTGDLSPVDYLFPGYNFQIQADTAFVNGRIDICGAPTPRHIGLANDGSVKLLDKQSFRDTGDTYYIGRDDSTISGNVPTWKLGEFLYYDGEVSISDREKLEGHLAWKWNLQANLPSAHPYKNYSPNPFSPTQISNCYVWLDGNDAATITKGVSSNIISWNSKISGLTAVFNSSNTAGGITPVAPKTDVSTIGLDNAVYFDTSRSRLELPNFAPKNQARSIFMVAQFVSKSGVEYTSPVFGLSNDFRTYLFYSGSVYNTGITPTTKLGAGAVTSEVTDVVGTNPYTLAIINSETLGSNVVAYSGASVSTFNTTYSGPAKFYTTNGFDNSIPTSWTSAGISNVLDIAQTTPSVVVVDISNIRYSTTGSSWITPTVDTSGQFTRVVTDGSSQIVVTGYRDLSGTIGRVYVSSNAGVSWDSSDTSVRFDSIPISTASLYSSNRYFLGQAGNYTPVLMGGNTMAISPNGIHWRSLSNYPYTGTIYSGAQSNGLWVVGGSNDPSLTPMRYSYDTMLWNAINFSDFSSCRTITHDNKYWIAGGDGVLAYSLNGLDWSNSGDASFNNVYALTATGSTYVAGGEAGASGLIKYSTDAQQWNDISSAQPISSSVNGLASEGTTVVAVGEGATKIAYSTDGGITWNAGLEDTFLGTRGNAVASRAANAWVAVGEAGGGDYSILFSDNGSNWYGVDGTAALDASLTSVVWTGDKWLAASSNNVLYSFDGNANWFPVFGSTYMSNIQTLVVGDPVVKPSLLYADASNISSWNTVSTGMDIVYDMDQSNGTIVAVGRGGNTMIKSIDNGTSWVPVSSGITEEITGVKYGNGIWMIVGKNSGQSLLRYSSNLTTWSNAFSNTTPTATTRGLLFDGNSWTSSIYGTYPDGITQSTYLYPYHSAKKTDVDSNWLTIKGTTLSTWFEKYMFRLLSNGTPTATFSIPSSPGPLMFTSPTVTSYLYYQYVPITPIEITASGIDEFGYFYAFGLPTGLELVPDPNGTTAEIRGTPVETFINGTTVYILLRNGVYTTIMAIRMTVIIPRILKKQTSAAAYTSYIRQYTEVNAAQNARDNRVFPTQERALGEFMAPEAPDVVTPSNCPC